MTDSLIQFNYSDNVHMISIYVRSDTHEDILIPFLYNSFIELNKLSRKVGWAYIVTELISKIVQKYEGLVSVKQLVKDENCNTIFKHIISIAQDYYDDIKNNLIDYITIHSKFPITNKLIFDGKLKDYHDKIILSTINNKL